MKSFEVLAHWPQWEKASAAEIFASPAWRMKTGVQGESYLLRKAAVFPADLLYLRIAFEETEVTLGLAKSAAFPELAAVWEARAEVPEPILLALLERACGVLFQTVENVFRRQLSIKGIVAGNEAVARASTAFVLTKEEGNSEVCTFTIALTESLTEELGQLKALDPADETLRAMELPVRYELAAFALAPADAASLKAGDALLLPEVDAQGRSQAARWKIGESFLVANNALDLWQEDDLYHVTADVPMSITFGALCDGQVPTPNSLPTLSLIHRGRRVAQGHLAPLGAQQSFAIEEVL